MIINNSMERSQADYGNQEELKITHHDLIAYERPLHAGKCKV